MSASLARITTLLAVAACTAAGAQSVNPPPLPPGSEIVRIVPGLQQVEQERSKRASRAAPRSNRNFTIDDSLPLPSAPASQPTGSTGK